MWRMNGATANERLAQARTAAAAFEATRGTIAGVLDMQVGVNVVDAPDAWDLALSMRFENRAALAAYGDDPAHLEIKKLVGPMRMERKQVDFELKPPQSK
jgi:hypothetical protein